MKISDIAAADGIVTELGEPANGKFSIPEEIGPRVEDAITPEEIRRKRRQAAAYRLVHETDIDSLDDDNAKAMFQASTKAYYGWMDPDGSVCFGDRKSEDFRQNLKTLRDCWDGKADAMVSPEVKAFAAMSDEEKLKVAKEDDARLDNFWNRAGSNLKEERGTGNVAVLKSLWGFLGKAFAAKALSDAGDLENMSAAANEAVGKLKETGNKVAEAYWRETDEERQRSDADIVADYEKRIHKNQRMADFAALSERLDGPSSAALTRSLNDGRLDAKELEKLSGADQAKVISAYEVLSGDKTHGCILGIDTDFTDDTAMNRAQMVIYSLQQSLIGVGEDVLDMGKSGAKYAYALGWLKAGQERDEFFRRWSLEERVKAANDRPLPEGGFWAQMFTGAAESAWLVAPFAWGRAAKGAKAVREAQVAAKGAAWRGELAEVYARLGYHAETLGEGLRAIHRMERAAGAEIAAKYGTQIAAAKFATFSTFAEEFIGDADASGIDRRYSVPLALAVGLVNAKIEELYVPGLDRQLTRGEIQAIGRKALKDAIAEGKLLDFAAHYVEKVSQAGMRTAVTEGAVEEPLQDFTNEHAKRVARIVAEARERNAGISETTAKALVAAFAITPEDFQNYLNTCVDMMPMATWYALGGEQLTRARNRMFRRIVGKTNKDDLDRGIAYYQNEGARLYGETLAYLQERAMEAEEEGEGIGDQGSGVRKELGTRRAGGGKSGKKGQRKQWYRKNPGKVTIEAKVEEDGPDFEETFEGRVQRLRGERQNAAVKLINDGRAVFERSTSGRVADDIAKELRVDPRLAEMMADFYSEERELTMFNPSLRGKTAQYRLPDLSEESLSRLPVKRRIESADGKVVAVELDVKDADGKPMVLTYANVTHPLLNADGTVNREMLDEMIADDSAFGVSWDSRKTGLAWKDMSLLDRKIRAVAYANGLANAGLADGMFEFTAKDGSKVSVPAQSVISLMNGDIAALARQVLPEEIADDVTRGAAATGLTVWHETSHALWRAAKTQLKDGEVQELATILGIDATQKDWEAALDEAMAGEFEQWAAGQYVPNPMRTKFERFQGWLSENLPGFGTKAQMTDEDGKPFTLDGFYRRVLEGRFSGIAEAIPEKSEELGVNSEKGRGKSKAAASDGLNAAVGGAYAPADESAKNGGKVVHSEIQENKGENGVGGLVSAEEQKTSPLEFVSEGVSLDDANAALAKLKGKDYTNKATGITARLSSDGAGKLVSNAATAKSQKNGFTKEQHNALAANIDKLFTNAVLFESRPDRNGDVNIKSIKRFVCPVKFGDTEAAAYITVKESVEHGHRIYSVEGMKIAELSPMVRRALSDRNSADNPATADSISKPAAEVKGDELPEYLKEYANWDHGNRVDRTVPKKRWKIKCRLVLMNIGDLVLQQAQDRDSKSDAYRKKVSRLADTWNAEQGVKMDQSVQMSVPTAFAEDVVPGAVKNSVFGGNTRASAMAEVYRRGGEKAEKLRAAQIAMAERRGIEKAPGWEQGPVVVAIMEEFDPADDIDQDVPSAMELAKLSNGSVADGYTETEKARGDGAAMLADDVISLFEIDPKTGEIVDDDALYAKKRLNPVGWFNTRLEETDSDRQKKFLDEGGNLSAEGRRMIRDAILSELFRGEAADRIIADADRLGMKNEMLALMRLAPDILGVATDADHAQYDLRGVLSEALAWIHRWRTEDVRAMKAAGANPADWNRRRNGVRTDAAAQATDWAQFRDGDLVGKPSEAARIVADLFAAANGMVNWRAREGAEDGEKWEVNTENANALAARRLISGFIGDYLKNVKNATAPAEDSLFAGTDDAAKVAPPTVEEILRTQRGTRFSAARPVTLAEKAGPYFPAGTRFSVGTVKPATAEEYDAVIVAAGETKDFGVAAWLFPDGRMPMPKMTRTRWGTMARNHDSIFYILNRGNLELGDMTGYIDTLAGGAMRLDLDNGGVEMTRKPSDVQMDAIYDICEAAYQKMEADDLDTFRVDISDDNGSTLFTLQYPRKTSARRIIDDIKNYYDSGWIPDNATGPEVERRREEAAKPKGVQKGAAVEYPDASEELRAMSDAAESPRWSVGEGGLSEVVGQLVETYGTTEDYREAGYVLQDGRMLDLSGRKLGARNVDGKRTVDHREVADEVGGTIDILLDDGFIRLHPETGGINLAAKVASRPTQEQVETLRGFIEKFDGEVSVDLTIPYVGHAGTATYENGTSPERVINEISRYYDEGVPLSGKGVQPNGEFRWSVARAYNPDAEVEIVDGRIEPEFKNLTAGEIRRYLRDKYQGREVTIRSDGTVAEFTVKGLEAALKKRGKHRRALHQLDKLVEGSHFTRYEENDGQKKHEHLKGQFVYTAALRLMDGVYGVELKLDDPIGSEKTRFKGQTLKTKIADAMLSASRVEDVVLASYDETSAAKTIRLRDLVEAGGSIAKSAADGNGMRWSIGARRRAEFRELMGRKRPDIAPEDIEAYLDEIAGYDNAKKQKLAVHWIITGAIELPEDAYKLDKAIATAERAKVDPFQYRNPEDIFAAFPQHLPKEKPIDPDTVPELTGKRDMGHGVTVYDVQDDRDGQAAMRRIINTHFGKDASPWCLLQGEGDTGELSGQAWHYWQHYSALPKKVAFLNGRLLAFMATDRKEVEGGRLEVEQRNLTSSVQPATSNLQPAIPEQWWDRKDASHAGIPIEGKIAGDPLGRSGLRELKDGKLELVGRTWKGDRKNGKYEEWEGEQKALEEEHKDGRTVGWRRTYRNGKLEKVQHYDENGKFDRPALEFHENGNLARYVEYGENDDLKRMSNFGNDGTLREYREERDDRTSLAKIAASFYLQDSAIVSWTDDAGDYYSATTDLNGNLSSVEKIANGEYGRRAVDLSDAAIRAKLEGESAAVLEAVKAEAAAIYREYAINGVKSEELGVKSDGETLNSQLSTHNSSRWSIGGLYTGSAADYEKPSLLKVGTGEGSQVYGWGLYASSERGVAEGYANIGKYFDRKALTVNGKVHFDLNDHNIDESVATAWSYVLAKNGSKNEAIKNLKEHADYFDESGNYGEAKTLRDALNYLETTSDVFGVEDPKKYIYEQTFFTNRAPGDESHLLKWYEPVSEQQQKWIADQISKEGLEKQIFNDYHHGEYDDPGTIGQSLSTKYDSVDDWLKNSTAAKIYEGLEMGLGSPQAASEFLARADIDGIKYPVDSYGKTVKDGDTAGWNYVSFRDDNIRVDHKWVDGQQRWSVAALSSGERVVVLDRAEEIAKINLNDPKSLHDYLVWKVGETIFDNFVIGAEAPNEYVYSKDAQGNNKRVRKAKAKLATGLDEAAATAGEASTERAAHKEREGGVYYRRRFLFAAPSGFGGDYRAYSADMISYKENGVEQFYDVVNIEDAPSASADLTQMSARIAANGTSRIPADGGATPRSVPNPAADDKAVQGRWSAALGRAMRERGEELGKSGGVAGAFFRDRWGNESRWSSAFPKFRDMDDDQFIIAALAAGMAVNPKKATPKSNSRTAYGFGVRMRREVEDMVRRAHPELEGVSGGVTGRAADIMMLAQYMARDFRKEIERGIPESEILKRLPKKMEGVYRGELARHAHRGAKVMAYGKEAMDEFERRWERKVANAVAAQNGIEAELFQQWAGVDFSELLSGVLENRREATEDKPKKKPVGTEPPDGAAGTGERTGGAAGAAEDERERLKDPRGFALHVVDLAAKYWREKHGLGEPRKETRKRKLDAVDPVWADAVAMQFLRKTAEGVYRQLVRDLVYSQARETVTKVIDKMEHAPTVDTLVSQMAFVGEIIHARHVRETKQELCERLDQFLKDNFGTSGRFKPDREELRRTVSAQMELMARYTRHAIWLTPEAMDQEVETLNGNLELVAREFRDAGRDVDQSKVADETERKLNVLREFGALRYRPVAEIEAACRWWDDALTGGQDEIVRAGWERDAATKAAAEIAARAVSDPKRRTARRPGKNWGDYLTSHMGLMTMLRDMARFASGDLQEAFERILRHLELEIQKAGTRAMTRNRERMDELARAVQRIYGVKDFRKVLRALTEEDARFEEFMGEVAPGVKDVPTKGRAMQLLVSLLQVGHPVKVVDKDGTERTEWVGGYHDNIEAHKRQGQAERLKDLMSAEDMNFIRWLGERYERNREGLSAVAESLFGIGVYAETANYFPVRMRLDPQGLEKGEPVGWSVFPRALTPRVKNLRDFNTSYDILQLYMSQMEEEEQWMAHAKLALELRGIFGRSELQKAIVAHHGVEANKIIQGFITDILTGHGTHERVNGSVTYWSDKVRGLAALCALGGNVGVTLKQTTSIPAFGFEIGLVKTGSYVLTAFSKEGREAMAKIFDSDERRNRWQVGNSEAVKNALAMESPNALMRLMRASMFTNKVGDVVPALLVGQGIYRDAIAQGMSEEDAMAKTWILIERTQQSGRIENQPVFVRRSRIGRLLFQFLSTQVQYLGYELKDIRAVLANPKDAKRWAKMTGTIVNNHFLLTSLYYWMGQLWQGILGCDPDDEDQMKDWIVSCLLGPFGALFVLGFTATEALNAAVKGRKYGQKKSIPLVDFAGRIFVDDTIRLANAVLAERKSQDVIDSIGRFASDMNATIRDVLKVLKNHTDLLGRKKGKRKAK